MTKTFKGGDKITMKPGVMSFYRASLGGQTGTVLETNIRYAEGHTALVNFPSVGIMLVRPEDIETPTPFTHGYTTVTPLMDNGVSDLWVGYGPSNSVTVNRDWVDAMVAFRKQDPLDVMYEAPAYTPPEVPKKGDYVRLTQKNGTVREGEVTRVDGNDTYQSVELDGEMAGMICLKEPANWGSDIVRVEHVTRPVKVPEIGKWVEATTYDGEKHTFEVTAHKENQWWAFLQKGVHNYDDFFVSARDKGDDRERSIKSWVYVDAPTLPVEIDGYLVVKQPWGGARVYRKDDTEGIENCTRGEMSVSSVKNGYKDIARYAESTSLQQFVPAILAGIKFLTLEDKEA